MALDTMPDRRSFAASVIRGNRARRDLAPRECAVVPTGRFAPVEVPESERRAVLKVAQCRELAAAGELHIDGRDLVPLHLLWFRTEHVVGYAERSHSDSLDVMLVSVGLRPSSGKTNGAWDAMRRREWVRFDTADRMLCALGLTTAVLGDPVFSPQAPSSPQLVAVAS